MEEKVRTIEENINKKLEDKLQQMDLEINRRVEERVNTDLREEVDRLVMGRIQAMMAEQPIVAAISQNKKFQCSVCDWRGKTQAVVKCHVTKVHKNGA